MCYWDRVSLCSHGCSGTHTVDQAGLKLRDLSVSAAWMLGLKACDATITQQQLIFNLENPSDRDL